MQQQLQFLTQKMHQIELEKQTLKYSQQNPQENEIYKQKIQKILEEQKKLEIKQIETKHKEMLKKTEAEYKQFLEEVDKTLLEQEEELDQIKDLNRQYQCKLEQNIETIAAQQNDIDTYRNTVDTLQR